MPDIIAISPGPALKGLKDISGSHSRFLSSTSLEDLAATSVKRIGSLEVLVDIIGAPGQLENGGQVP